MKLRVGSEMLSGNRLNAPSSTHSPAQGLVSLLCTASWVAGHGPIMDIHVDLRFGNC